MSKPTENLKSTLLFVSDNVLVLATVFMFVGFFLLLTGFFSWDGDKFLSRSGTLLPAVILGLSLIGIGLALFTRGPNKKDKTIVFYSPTIKANSFFIERHGRKLSPQNHYSFGQYCARL